jgi:hypothetical protein
MSEIYVILFGVNQVFKIEKGITNAVLKLATFRYYTMIQE